MPFTLPPLPFARDALAPHMSAETIDFHHGKHHQAYVDKTNALAAAGGHGDKSLLDLIAAAPPGPLFDNAAQLWNHSFFWQCLSAERSAPSAALAAQIDQAFGSFADFKAAFVAEAVAHFGSGWAWLVLAEGALKIVSLHDGDTPVAHADMAPLLTIDLWEHAYYIDYRHARPQFIAAVFDTLINWDFVAENLDGAGARRADQQP
jgi:superoxide dismutase, Fe-Mn family